MKRSIRVLLSVGAGLAILLQSGCLTPLDVYSIAEGQFIAFVNALINTAVSDAIRGVLGQ